MDAELLFLRSSPSNRGAVNSTKQSHWVCQHRRLIAKEWSISIRATHQHYVYSAQSQVNPFSIGFFLSKYTKSVRHNLTFPFNQLEKIVYGCVLSYNKYYGLRWFRYFARLKYIHNYSFSFVFCYNSVVNSIVIHMVFFFVLFTSIGFTIFIERNLLISVQPKSISWDIMYNIVSSVWNFIRLYSSLIYYYSLCWFLELSFDWN